MALTTCRDRPITCDEWERFEIVVDVAEDANEIFLGMIVAGKAQAWLDKAVLEIVDNDVPTTGMNSRTVESSFFTGWLWLALFVMVLFALSQMENNFAQRFALKFTIVYWVLYRPCRVHVWIGLQNPLEHSAVWEITVDSPFSGLTKLTTSWSNFQSEIVRWTANNIFGIEQRLPPPGGSGDTTHSYILLFIYFVIAISISSIWALVDRRKVDQIGLRDTTRTFLRYALGDLAVHVRESLKSDSFKRSSPLEVSPLKCS